ncbi:flagellar basal body rod protein FlgC [Paenibacillus apiarius]|uniref:Flagellar basal-body rod protein FlgC n=1 Tax=Paenibacillus apiarius TaxID=46240 RepID=A0ABT4DLX3_9BACL|nr:flagellar basal body rod protein FlgC [Paenibacillus apiarius]MCY9516180.1 flagellar basal body rod protein FlgC [Paenibacillus apiarius]MCY9518361.1 flagellar basal body rod protein FlgC [Paenibacillus apiarius]MCY9551238.1 flagellar basal body rod protein FlgC [Paenibacillus apiarius]MCY9558392.1 flagellar basal body rod protein FlgC [Paenibacillus apiarius]MCY9684792.1 flagellar basal body rod protein FlgC [Paenibacillus apiarius]
MQISNSFQISASGLTAQRLRMDVISSNIANAETTRAQFVDGKFVPYRRKVVVMSPTESSFKQFLQSAMEGQAATRGVKVTQIKADASDFKLVYNPTHPDSDENGYVSMPNVDMAKEMVDMIAATRSYEANVTALNASKSMIMKALEIGKG